MKSIILIFVFSCACLAQPFGFGLKGGVPMNDFVKAVNQGSSLSYVASTDRYVIGPMAELRLPFSLAIEVDALYRHYGFSGAPGSVNTGAWEFPIVAKYKFKAPLIKPYIEAGVAWDKLSGLTQAIASATKASPLKNDVTRGFVIGGGIEVKALIIHIAPEIRYTRWGDQHFLDPIALLKSNQNQAEFLIGISF